MRYRTCSLPALAALAIAVLFAGLPGRADDQPPEPSPAAAEMLKSMREKGILSDEEYEDIYRRQARYEADQQAAASIPGWMKNWTFGGDFRFRFDRQTFNGGATTQPGQPFQIDQHNVEVTNVDSMGVFSGTDTTQRDRYLVRVRLGLEKRMDDFTFGARIATSGGTSYGASLIGSEKSGSFVRSLLANPRTTNVALGDYFEPKGVYFDRVYLRWNPFFAKTLGISIGKFANPFYGGQNPAERTVWDPDIQPEGAALQHELALLPELWFDTNAGYFVLDQIGSTTIQLIDNATALTVAPNYDSAYPDMWGAQEAINARPWDWLLANARVSYYSLQHLNTGFVAAINSLGNTGTAVNPNPLFVVLGPNDPLFQSGRSRGKLEEIVFDGFLDFRIWTNPDIHVKPFGLYSEILTTHRENEAFSLGGELGIANTVTLTAGYSQIERDGTVALFTDDDLFDGVTNVRGWYVSAEARLTSFLRLRGSFMKSRIYHSECLLAKAGLVTECDFGLAPLNQLLTETERDRTRLQIDLLAEF